MDDTMEQLRKIFQESLLIYHYRESKPVVPRDRKFTHNNTEDED
tara:strand:+ start:1399 stop:1530 length:132 start_codon:yes stop_codon:yes gene_type:complete